MQRIPHILVALVATLTLALPANAPAMLSADGGGGVPKRHKAKPPQPKPKPNPQPAPSPKPNRDRRPTRTREHDARPATSSPTALSHRGYGEPKRQRRRAPRSARRRTRSSHERGHRRTRVRTNARTYVSALDQIEADGGALRTGTARAIQLARNPRVKRRAHRIIHRREVRAERQAARQRQRRRARRTVTHGQLYISARRRLRDNGGMLNGGLARQIAYGNEPRVRRFVDRLDGLRRERRAERRQRERRADVRNRARSYVNALDQIERNGGALNTGLARSLSLADDPAVDRMAKRMLQEAKRRERRQAIRARALHALKGSHVEPPENPRVRRAMNRIRERRRVREEGRRYADVLEQIERNGGALNMGLARALGELGDDPRVRRIAAREIKLRERGHLQEIYGPLDGPSLLDPTLGLALPWPGKGGSIGLTLEARCMRAATPRAVVSCVSNGRKPPVRVELSGEVTGEISRGDPRLSPDGLEYETLALSTGLRVTGGLKANLPRGYGITLDGFTGRSLEYQLMVTSDRADEIAEGAEPPNPVDPRSLEPGETIVMRSEDYEGNGQAISYRVLQASLGFEEGRRLSSGVERRGESTVRIYVGDEDFVRQALALRLGTEDLGIAAGVSKEFADGRLRTIDLSLNRRGGWNAYQRFVSTGTLPFSGRPGVRRSADVDSASWSTTHSLELDAGPLHVGDSSTIQEGDVTETHHSDGRVGYAFTDRIGGVTYMERVTEGRQGRVRGSRYSLLLQGADSGYTQATLDLRGSPPELAGDDQNLRIDFTEGELMALRDDAIQAISMATKSGDRDGLSPDEVEELVGDDPYAVVPGMVMGPSTGSYLTGLASARHPAEVLDEIYRRSWGDPTKLLDQLYTMQVTPADFEGEPAPSPLHDGVTPPPGRVTVFGG